MTTERDVLDALHRRYARPIVGNGPRYVCAEHVRSTAGFDAPRTLDLMVLDLWPSGGLEVHGFEVKCSRADWRRELADPTKAGTFTPHLDRMWLAVSDPAIVRLEELPERWGVMAMTKADTMRAVRPAQLLRGPFGYGAEKPPMPRDLMAALARSIARTAVRRAEVAA